MAGTKIKFIMLARQTISFLFKGAVISAVVNPNPAPNMLVKIKMKENMLANRWIKGCMLSP